MILREVGRVQALYRYPVKSMAAEALGGVDVSWHGLPGDRRWAFVQERLVRSGFPWLTIRERAELWRFRPAFSDPDRPDASTTLVTTPEGETYDVVDDALAERLGGGVRVMKQDRGVFDAMPLSLLSSQSVASLSSLTGIALDPRRFRPNLLVDAAGGEPFAEDDWVGAVLRIGALRMRVDQRDSRCVIVNVDPETTERDARVLKAVGRERDACTGVYGTTVEPGRVAVGDPVVLEG